MKQDNILVVGALGQIGTDLIPELQTIYGETHVIASDIVEKRNLKRTILADSVQYEHLNILDSERLGALIRTYKITQVYLLAAILSAKGESNPKFAWRLNMEGLINVLEVAKSYGIKVFWPSSIAVFGPHSPLIDTPQETPMNPITIYGISKVAGENWAAYYHLKYGVDIRSLRYPGLISYKALPGGGTTDYAVDIFYQALQKGSYTCFISKDLALPMMYMPDAIRATLELMEAPADTISIRSSYNLAGMSFSPDQLANEIQKHLPSFTIDYAPDFRQEIAESWPRSVDDSQSQQDWGWKMEYDLGKMVKDMLGNLSERLKIR